MNKAKITFKPKETKTQKTFKKGTLTQKEKDELLLILAEKAGLLE